MGAGGREPSERGAEARREAQALAREVLAADPANAEAWYALGLAAAQDHAWEDAAAHFEKACEHAPERAEFRAEFAAALDARAADLARDFRTRDALRLLDRAHAAVPDDARIQAHRAYALADLGDFDAARAAAESALAGAPESAAACDALGLALAGLEKFDDAIAMQQRALELEPGRASALNNLGTAYHGAGHLDEAVAALQRAHDAEPDNPRILNNLGNAHAAKGDPAAARACLEEALARAPGWPEARYNLSMALLAAGDFARGWDEYEHRWRCQAFPSTRREFPYPAWDGGDPRGKTLLVWSEQGVGDEVMFANALPDAIRAAGHVVIECNPRFEPIFARSFPQATVVVRADPPDPAIAAAGPDAHAPMASLCRRFRRSRDAFPREPGFYLEADQARAADCRARMDAAGKGPKIGICWRSGNPRVGHLRSAKLDLWDGLLGRGNCVFVSLQYGEVGGELAEARARTGAVIHVDETIDAFASMDDWAAEIAALDLVISVDNSTVQVSGALGVPTWTLLSDVPEWRWLAKGDNSPWHPRMRVLRQRAAGDWGPVFADAETLLDEFLKGQGAGG